MTRFDDGPAKGKILMLKRAPYFLRAVLSPEGKWDALDQLDDQPEAGEKLFAYEIMEPPGWCFIRPGGRYPVARYKLVEPQPIEDQMMDEKAWAEWVQAAATLRGLAW